MEVKKKKGNRQGRIVEDEERRKNVRHKMLEISFVKVFIRGVLFTKLLGWIVIDYYHIEQGFYLEALGLSNRI